MRHEKTYRREIGELALEGGNIADVFEELVIVECAGYRLVVDSDSLLLFPFEEMFHGGEERVFQRLPRRK